MHEPNAGQIGLLLAAVVLFAAGGIVSLSRMRWDRDGTKSGLRVSSKACLYGGATVALCVLVWHSFTRRSWLPLEDNFDALIWLGLLLALFVAYTQRTHPLRGLDWFVMPIVVLLL